MIKFSKRMASLITAAAVALSTVTLPAYVGELPLLTVPAFADDTQETPVLSDTADATTVFGKLKNGLYTLESKTYTLTEDVKTNGRIYIPNGVDATVDLAGHTIDRGLTQLTEGGSVFGVAEGGTLTVKNGTVKGGARANGNGGGFNVNGKLTLDSVTVTGNSAQDAGGGIYVGGGTGPELYLEGTLTVTDNKAAGARSDIFLFAGKKIMFSGKVEIGSSIGVYHDDAEKIHRSQVNTASITRSRRVISSSATAVKRQRGTIAKRSLCTNILTAHGTLRK